MFCGCSTAFGAAPNENVCPVCMGMPGVLPVLNRQRGRARDPRGTRCALRDSAVLDFRSQELLLSRPAQGLSDQPVRDAGLQGRLHRDLPLDERRDAARAARRASISKKTPARISMSAGVSLVDFNRSGVPLVEIVSEPDIRTAEDAGAYLRELRAMLRYVDVSDGTDGRRQLALRRATFRCASAARPSSASRPRSRISTRSASSKRRSSTRSAGRSKSSRRAARSRRKPICGIPCARRRARCARRSSLTTIATSPSRTCRRCASRADLVEKVQTDDAGAARRRAARPLHRASSA